MLSLLTSSSDLTEPTCLSPCSSGFVFDLITGDKRIAIYDNQHRAQVRVCVYVLMTWTTCSFLRRNLLQWSRLYALKEVMLCNMLYFLSSFYKSVICIYILSDMNFELCACQLHLAGCMADVSRPMVAILNTCYKHNVTL